MENIINYVNEFGAMISSFTESLNYDAGAEIFYSLVSIGLNMVSALGIVFAFAVPFLVIYWCIKSVGGAY